MEAAMEDAMENYMRKHEAATHVTALLCLALPHDLREFDVEPLVRDGIPVPTHKHISCLVHIVADIIRDCRLSREDIIRELDKINEKACGEVIRCAMLPEGAQPPSSSLPKPVSANATRHGVNYPITKTLTELLKPHKHTGPFTSDSLEN